MGQAVARYFSSLGLSYVEVTKKSNTVPDKSQTSGCSAPAASALPHSWAKLELSKTSVSVPPLWPALQP